MKKKKIVKKKLIPDCFDVESEVCRDNCPGPGKNSRKNKCPSYLKAKKNEER